MMMQLHTVALGFVNKHETGQQEQDPFQQNKNMIQKYIIRLLNLINIACTKPFGFKSSPCH
jgi:hypothetical protein